MKKWICKAMSIFRSKKGEMLVESIASLLVFTILILGVTTMIQTALRMTGMLTKEAADMQTAVNSVMLSAYERADPANITFTYEINSVSKTATHPVISNDADDGITAFAPPASSSDPEEGEP